MQWLTYSLALKSYQKPQRRYSCIAEEPLASQKFLIMFLIL